MALDEPKEQEEAVVINGVSVLIDDQVRPYAANQVLDYASGRQGEGFTLQPVGGSCC